VVRRILRRADTKPRVLGARQLHALGSVDVSPDEIISAYLLRPAIVADREDTLKDVKRIRDLVATSAAAAARTFRLRLRNADSQLATFQILSVKSLDCRFCFGLIGHFNEGESPLPSGFPVGGYCARYYGPILGEQVFKLLFGELKREISNKQFVIHSKITERREYFEALSHIHLGLKVIFKIWDFGSLRLSRTWHLRL